MRTRRPGGRRASPVVGCRSSCGASTAAARHRTKGPSMSHKWTFAAVTTAALAALVNVGFAAGPSYFRAEPAFNGTSLAGWHPMGGANWRVDNGEIVGTPAAPSGGWLVFDKSLQDTGFFASFRCLNGCRTGVLLRAQKTSDGMKGIFVSLDEGDLASYNVTLDA